MDLPSHSQLLLPLLQVIGEHGGKLRASEAVCAISDKLQLGSDITSAVAHIGAQEVNLFSRRVRWVRQDAVRRGFITNEERSAWSLSERGYEHLQNCQPGIVVIIYETEQGVALWADAQTASGVLEPGSINLILTSPPYPLVKQKDYGNPVGNQYLEWLSDLAGGWRKLLVDDGSLVLNLGDTWESGQPTLSLYQERLLIKLCDQLQYHLAQRLVWQNPCKIPAASWVTVKRCRLKTVTEQIFWLSKSPHPKADNRRVLRPYSDRMKRTIARGGERNRPERPSGHGNALAQFARDNGGTIPSNVLIAPNARSNDSYMKGCRDAGLPIHPARFPPALPELLIQLLTEPGDVVYDPFCGSNTVGETCERLGRHWIGSERSFTYLEGSKFRFPKANERH